MAALTLDEILTIVLRPHMVCQLHSVIIKESGGLDGLRDLGGLESALNRPAQIISYHQGELDIHTLAASLGHAVIQNHPFIDGNKRTAMLLILVFYGSLDEKLKISVDRLEDMMVEMASHHMTLDACIEELRGK